MPGVECRVDDILLTGPTDKVHVRRLKETTDRLEVARFQHKLDKYRFMEPMVDYIGHEVSSQGIIPVS